MSTFDFEDTLNALPLPRLENSCKLYLESVEAQLINEPDGKMSALNRQIFERTKSIVNGFKKYEGEQLDKEFRQLMGNKKNWLEENWDHLYLSMRGSSALWINYGGPKKRYPLVTDVDDIQIWNASLALTTLLEYWKLLRSNNYFPVDKTSKNEKLSMQQYRYIMNSCRIPRKGLDEYVNYFSTVNEKSNCPNHCVVLCNGRIYKIDIDGLSVAQTAELLKMTRELSYANGKGDGLAGMTFADRDEWAEIRDFLISQSRRNCESFRLIESALCCISLDPYRPRTREDMIWRALFGDPSNRWADKPNSYVLYADGSFNSFCEHTKVDGLIHVIFFFIT